MKRVDVKILIAIVRGAIATVFSERVKVIQKMKKIKTEWLSCQLNVNNVYSVKKKQFYNRSHAIGSIHDAQTMKSIRTRRSRKYSKRYSVFYRLDLNTRRVSSIERSRTRHFYHFRYNSSSWIRRSQRTLSSINKKVIRRIFLSFLTLNIAQAYACTISTDASSRKNKKLSESRKTAWYSS